MNRSAVIDWLGSLTDKQFVELFYDSVADRNMTHESERHYLQEHFVLATSTRSLNDDDQWGAWETQLVALHDAASYPEGWSDDAPICQEGHCCGHQVVSWAKNQRCPACGQCVYGT